MEKGENPNRFLYDRFRISPEELNAEYPWSLVQDAPLKEADAGKARVALIHNARLQYRLAVQRGQRTQSQPLRVEPVLFHFVRYEGNAPPTLLGRGIVDETQEGYRIQGLENGTDGLVTREGEIRGIAREDIIRCLTPTNVSLSREIWIDGNRRTPSIRVDLRRADGYGITTPLPGGRS